MDQDEEHLRLLSIFHYVLGSIVALFSSFALIYVIIGIASLMHPDQWSQSPPAIVGGIFLVIGCALLLIGWTYAICLCVSGRFLAHHRSYTFCFVIAVLSCMFSPFGTILGVFSILVLVRPSVKALFRN